MGLETSRSGYQGLVHPCSSFSPVPLGFEHHWNIDLQGGVFPQEKFPDTKETHKVRGTESFATDLSHRDLEKTIS